MRRIFHSHPIQSPMAPMLLPLAMPHGFLFVLNYPEPVGKLHVPLKQLKEYDNKIIECTWDPLIGPDGAQWTKERILATQKRDPKFKCGNWKFMRIRTDKSLPNGFKTLQGCLRSISHGLTEKELLEFVSTKAKPYHETADNRLPEIKHPGGNHHDNSQLTTGSEHPDAGERPIAL
ncbi:hypothetical protein SARC_08682 [Sphaeroforma arctica JP610]|uniref:mRNA capping enzyme C-terminal domain-containing protein n=1 Tax=Sphaeroforma arctica JP610 TaxID=667725 RepID=A0A0L0FQT1_9EUKA|nr:hypothetical protein SARC_08682 [Sphaeroforma arctica JP610]KNC78906.1 hypothetical protein SARC_08682 [Sphaeroforma arctica JP610]|eukprot:XP_014152808.1 hypothetical protein SARC_08682 [Sphaeroforma arctica JP610]